MIRRPWGWFIVLRQTPTMWVKIIRVRRGQRTSVQYHQFRDETIYSLGGKRFVPRTEVHCLYCGFYLEIARGEPKEEDIERIDDMYGRA